MSGAAGGEWLRRLEAEIARELGQPVSIAAGGEMPEGAAAARLELPGARLTLAVEREELAGVLVAGRLIAADQREAAGELWAGILASVAARLGGTAGEAVGEAAADGGEPCTLRLGEAAMRMALTVESKMESDAASGQGSGPASGGSPSGRAGTGEEANFDLLLEVELNALVRFGSREVELKDLLELGSGDVLELDRQIGDPVDLIVGDKIVARGEVVLVDGNFGLRVTEVAEPVRRLESIRCLW